MIMQGYPTTRIQHSLCIVSSWQDHIYDVVIHLLTICMYGSVRVRACARARLVTSDRDENAVSVEAVFLYTSMSGCTDESLSGCAK